MIWESSYWKDDLLRQAQILRAVSHKGVGLRSHLRR
jgi:hypothetical protein